MNFLLVVVRAFGEHKPGDTILDDTVISTILAGECANHVVRVTRPLQEG